MMTVEYGMETMRENLLKTQKSDADNSMTGSDPKHLVRRLESWVSGAVKDGKITTEEGKEFISNYRAGLYGYTYLE